MSRATNPAAPMKVARAEIRSVTSEAAGGLRVCATRMVATIIETASPRVSRRGSECREFLTQ